MQFIVAVSTGWTTLWRLVAHMLTITASQEGGITGVGEGKGVASACFQFLPTVNKQKTFTIYFCLSSSFSRKGGRGCWLDQGGQIICNEWGRSWFKVWREGRAEKVQKSTPCMHSQVFFLSIEAGEVAAVVALFQIPCWQDWGGLEQEEFKRGLGETSLELQKNDGESLDYKRGAALDQVISDSSDVGGKAAGLQLWWWLLRSPRFVGSLASNHRVPLIERCCWRRGRQWGGEALHPTEIEQVVWH